MRNPELRRGMDEGEHYFGLWRTTWPGAEGAYPALRQVL
jgi:hypothetical protein